MKRITQQEHSLRWGKPLPPQEWGLARKIQGFIYPALTTLQFPNLLAKVPIGQTQPEANGKGAQDRKISLLNYERVWRRAKRRSGGLHGGYPAFHPICLPRALPATPHSFNFLHCTYNSDIFFLICICI